MMEKSQLPSRSSFFQIKHFIVEREPTLASKIWSCERNIKDRNDQLRQIETQLAEHDDQDQLFYLDLKNAEDACKNQDTYTDAYKRLFIQKRRLNRKRVSLKHQIDSLESKKALLNQEIEYLKSLQKPLVEEFGGFPNYDDEQLQIEYWSEKILQEINLCLVLNKAIGPEIIRNALSLPRDCEAYQSAFRLIQNNQQSALSSS